MVTVSSRLPCLLALLPVLLSACDTGSKTRYEDWAEKVSTIPLQPGDEYKKYAVADNHAEPAPSKVKVELLTPHQLWDARNGPLKLPTIETNEVSATSVVVPRQVPQTTQTTTQRAAVATAQTLIQLGAFSSQASAQAAWDRLAQGPGRTHLSGLSPLFESVSVNGSQLVRLRVSASPDQALSLCQSLAPSDPWCRQPRS